MKPVFVGQCPKDRFTEGEPLTYLVPKLADWMGVTRNEFDSHFVRVELSPHFDEEFSPGHWAASARNMRGLLENRRVVLLGRLVAECFDLYYRDYKFFQWFDHPGIYDTGLFCVIPDVSQEYDYMNINRVSDMLGTLWEIAK